MGVGKETRLFAHLHMLIFTVRNSSCGKVMFPQVSVCPRGWCTPPYGQTPQADTPWADTPLNQMATAADGTHPTGMHSCYT